MAITIRNKATEAMIRSIGARTGEGPSAAIKRLAEEELKKRASSVSEEEFERRMRAWDDLVEKYPPPNDGLSWAEIEVEMQSIFDYLDEEPAQADPNRVSPSKA